MIIRLEALIGVKVTRLQLL